METMMPLLSEVCFFAAGFLAAFVFGKDLLAACSRSGIERMIERVAAYRRKRSR
jgi:hypothetical protein